MTTDILLAVKLMNLRKDEMILSSSRATEIPSFRTQLTETLLPLHRNMAELPRCIVRGHEFTVGSFSYHKPRRFKRGYIPFLGGEQ